MPFDASATQKFRNDPKGFMDKNYVRVYGQGNLTKAREGKTGAAWAMKVLANNTALNAVNIGNADCVTVTGIGGRDSPKCFVGLFKEDDRQYRARVQDNQDEEHPLEVYFLPASANQIVGMRLRNDGPNIFLTDPISGCSIFATDLGQQHWVFHANAHGIAPGENDGPRIYMRNLFRRWIQGTNHDLTHYFDRPYYVDKTNLWMESWKNKKEKMGRNKSQMQTSLQHFGVFGIRTAGRWERYWQAAFLLESTRTGLKAFFRGAESKKFKIGVAELPAAPNPLPNP